MKYAIDVSIASYFYAGMANLAIQDILPATYSDLEDNSTLPALLDASHEDFHDMSIRLLNFDGIANSELYRVYQIASGWEGSGLIKNMSGLYVRQDES